MSNWMKYKLDSFKNGMRTSDQAREWAKEEDCQPYPFALGVMEQQLINLLRIAEEAVAELEKVNERLEKAENGLPEDSPYWAEVEALEAQEEQEKAASG